LVAHQSKNQVYLLTFLSLKKKQAIVEAEQGHERHLIKLGKEAQFQIKVRKDVRPNKHS
jgi:hypothetical protein